MTNEQRKGESVTISRMALYSLLEDRDMLLCLQNAGVDHWIGYSHAMDEFREMAERAYDKF